MEIGVGEAAKLMGVSDRRVRMLVAAGQVPSRQVAGRWLIEEADLPLSRPSARPMSARMAWALIEMISGGRPDVSPTELSRLRSKRRRLLDSDDAPRLLRSWLARRAGRRQLSAAPDDLADLRGDPRVLLSGVSDPRSELSAANEAEFYIAAQNFDALARDFMLSDKGHPNITVHVADHPLPSEATVGLVIADLADWSRPRENKRAIDLLHSEPDPK